jgi:hypothetical protein
MSGELHALAPHNLPAYIGGADGSDPLFTGIAIFVVVLILGIGVFYLKIHAIPEQLAHKHGNTQSQLIMVLALLALFTHNNVFWVLALILALLKLPDFLTPINNIARSLAKISGEPAETQSNDRDAKPQEH